MKKANLKKQMKSILMVLSVFAALFVVGTQQANAQTLSGSSSSQSALPALVSASEASARLNAQIDILSTDIKTTTPGSSAFIAFENKIEYYKGILDLITRGTTVPKAVRGGVNIVGHDAAGGLTANQKTALMNDAVSLLRV